MKITFKLYATLSDYLPLAARARSGFEVEVEEGTTPHQLIERYALPIKLCHLVMVNGSYIEPGRRDQQALAEGDVLAIWPPIAGG